MIVEIRNVHHRNKGAELMLRAIVARYADRPDVTLTANHRVGSFLQLRELGIKPLVFLRRERGYFTIPGGLVPRAARSALGVVHPDEVEVVLDAAGFAYGDQWGPDRAVAATRYYSSLREHGAKVVLLPQSLGPFSNPAVRKACYELLEQVDLVFPRDDTAAREVADLLGGSDDRVRQCPDFTPLVPGADGPPLPVDDRPAAVIPNRKMIQKGGLTREQYVAFLADVVEGFTGLGYSPFMLPHATFDHDLSKAVKKKLEWDVPELIEPDAMRLKGVIGRCHAIFSSRFHGLVSALSQGVPALATGWSHKYEHLLAEYRCPDALIDARDPYALDNAIVQVLADDAYGATRARLVERAAWNKEQATRMWAAVDAVVTPGGAAT